MMHITTDLSSFAGQSQAITGVYQFSSSAFRRFRKTFGDAIGFYLFLPLGVAIVWLLLFFFKRSLKKSLSEKVSLVDYKKTRLEYDRLNKIFQKSGSKRLQLDFSKAPFLLRGVLRLFVDILVIIKERRDAIGSALEQLDTTAPSTDLLKAVPEKDLWSNRAKVYEYRF